MCDKGKLRGTRYCREKRGSEEDQEELSNVKMKGGDEGSSRKEIKES